MELRELTNDEFSKFAEKYMLTSMYQTAEYGFVMNKQDCEVLFVGLVNDTNDIKAATLILIEKLSNFKYAYAPRGFLLDYTNFELLQEFTNAIKKYLKKRSVMAIKICPLIAKTKYTPTMNITLANPSFDKIFENLKKLKYYHLGYNNYFESLKPRFVAISELDKDTNKMFNKLHKEFKAKIKACDHAGVRIYKGNQNNLDFIYEQMRDKKAKGKEYVNDMYYYFNNSNKVDVYFAQLDTKTYLINTQIEYQKQINICNAMTEELFKNQGKASSELVSRKITEDNKLANLKNQLVYATNLLRKNPNGIIIASAMIIKHRKQVYLTLDGYDQQYKHLCAKHLLIWKLMEKYAAEGFKEFNLGGMTNPTIPDNKFKSLNEFKLNFNASCIEYAGDFELITSYPLYTLYRNSAPLRKILQK